jgi:hypothetical protein
MQNNLIEIVILTPRTPPISHQEHASLSVVEMLLSWGMPALPRILLTRVVRGMVVKAPKNVVAELNGRRGCLQSAALFSLYKQRHIFPLA